MTTPAFTPIGRNHVHQGVGDAGRVTAAEHSARAEQLASRGFEAGRKAQRLIHDGVRTLFGPAVAAPLEEALEAVTENMGEAIYNHQQADAARLADLVAADQRRRDLNSMVTNLYTERDQARAELIALARWVADNYSAAGHPVPDQVTEILAREEAPF